MPLLPSKGRRMSKTSYPTISERLFWQISGRSTPAATFETSPSCRSMRLKRRRTGRSTSSPMARISHDCKIQIIALQNRMQREYEAIGRMKNLLAS